MLPTGMSQPNSSEIATRTRFEDLYNAESKARDALERKWEALLGTKRALDRKLAALSGICRHDCRERADEAANADEDERSVSVGSHEGDS